MKKLGFCETPCGGKESTVSGPTFVLSKRELKNIFYNDLPCWGLRSIGIDLKKK